MHNNIGKPEGGEALDSASATFAAFSSNNIRPTAPPAMKSNISSLFEFLGKTMLSAAVFAAGAIGQTDEEQQFIESAESNTSFYFFVAVILIAGFGGAYYFWKKSKKNNPQPQYNYESRYKNSYSNTNGAYDMESVDTDKELEWLRKAKKAGTKSAPVGYKKVSPAKAASVDDASFETRAFQERMRKLQYAQLPINSFGELTKSKVYEPLPLSNDESLLNAIEQASDEFEEDESVRELAVKILTAFRNRNSVDALSQIALYDLSSILRSKAVSTLTDFDHESVFEAILLACADPTREVRAAAARGLFRLNFDRSDAWKRIIETNDEFRMSHAARAAIEAGIVVKSFDRLIHEDSKIAYEAFALVALLIKSGETRDLFDAIARHKDERVRFALLHVVRAVKDDRTFDNLQKVRVDSSCPTDVADRIRETVESFEAVPA